MHRWVFSEQNQRVPETGNAYSGLYLSGQAEHVCCEECPTSHPNDPIPVEPTGIKEVHTHPTITTKQTSPSSSSTSLESTSSSEPPIPTSPDTDPQIDETDEAVKEAAHIAVEPNTPRKRRASTVLISQSPKDVRKILLEGGKSDTKLIEKVCCGGGCCFLDNLPEDSALPLSELVAIPDNDAFRSLRLKLGPLSLESKLTKTVDLPSPTVSFGKLSNGIIPGRSTVERHPPQFVTPHPPYEVYSSKVHHARELTK